MPEEEVLVLDVAKAAQSSCSSYPSQAPVKHPVVLGAESKKAEVQQEEAREDPVENSAAERVQQEIAETIHSFACPCLSLLLETACEGFVPSVVTSSHEGTDFSGSNVDHLDNSNVDVLVLLAVA
jgi:hypothetical protein